MYELIVIGGGPAGLAAALSAHKKGLSKVLIVERDVELGGILNQCVHNGFGLHYFKEELTGPEYSGKFIDMVADTNVEIKLDTMALELVPGKDSHQVHLVSKENGYEVVESKSIVLAMGCRERTRGAINIPGARPAGIFTAGTAQRYINMEGFMVGKRVVILGSGDIGLIMARRMTLEGAEVLACVEVMPYSGGLMRNIVQCLDDYDIPLYLSHTIIDIKGKERLEQVTIAEVDSNRKPIAGTEIVLDCDTLLLSVGLIPENELSKQGNVALDPRTNGGVVDQSMETSVEGIFACGNVVHVHDLVDFVSEEATRAGESAAKYCLDGFAKDKEIVSLTGGESVSYVVPQQVNLAKDFEKITVFFRVNKTLADSRIVVATGGNEIAGFNRKYLLPGEMEKITLTKELLGEHPSREITIYIKEGGN